MNLTGKLSSPNKISTAYSFAGTIVFWIVLIIIMLLIKPVEKTKKYKEVQIVLDSMPAKKEISTTPSEASAPKAVKSESVAETGTEAVTETSAESASSVQESVPAPVPEQEVLPVQNTKAAPEKSSEVKKTVQKPDTSAAPKKEVQKTEPVKQTTKPAPVEPVYAKSVDDALDFDTGKKETRQQSFNWDMFDSDEPETDMQNSPSKVVQTKNVMTGTSGTSAASPNGPVSSEKQNQRDGKNSVSEGTKKNLASIGSASYVGTSIGATDGDSTGSDDYIFDGKNFRGSSGRTRGLLTPAVINITEHGDQITNNETVEIRFVVLSVGTIDKSTIEISPPVLTRAVKDEIINQLMKWRFSPDSEDAYAVFSLNIVKK